MILLNFIGLMTLMYFIIKASYWVAEADVRPVNRRISIFSTVGLWVNNRILIGISIPTYVPKTKTRLSVCPVFGSTVGIAKAWGIVINEKRVIGITEILYDL